MLEVRKRQSETPAALLARFTRRVRRSGILLEARKRRFHDRSVTRVKRRLSAIHREAKRQEMARMKKWGIA